MPENNVHPSRMPLSKFDYRASLHLEMGGAPFYAIIATAMRKADTLNLARLKHMWPQIWEDLQAWYDTPGALDD